MCPFSTTAVLQPPSKIDDNIHRLHIYSQNDWCNAHVSTDNHHRCYQLQRTRYCQHRLHPNVHFIWTGFPKGTYFLLSIYATLYIYCTFLSVPALKVYTVNHPHGSRHVQLYIAVNAAVSIRINNSLTFWHYWPMTFIAPCCHLEFASRNASLIEIDVGRKCEELKANGIGLRTFLLEELHQCWTGLY